jgi:hypothetical protein
MKRTALAAALLLSLSYAYAGTSTPQSTAFTYQGTLSASGHAANGNFDLTFKLFDAVTGGAQVGSTITMLQFPVVNGAFTTDLDFPGVFTGNQAWLEVMVGTQVLSPRQPINAVPVAGYALSGITGPSGAAGKNSLIAQTFEPAGPNCAAAGIRVASGVDANGNGILDPGEVTSTNYVCGLSAPADLTCTNQALQLQAIVSSWTGFPDTFPQPNAGDLISVSTALSDPNSCTDGRPVTPFTYQWQLQNPAGSKAVLANADGPAPTFTADVPGSYSVTVVGFDAIGHASPPMNATIVTTTCGVNPVSVDITSTPGTLSSPALLTAVGTTLDNMFAGCPARFATSFSYQWTTVSVPLPSTWQFSSPTSASTYFLPSVAGSYVVGVTAKDSNGISGSTTTTITFATLSAMADLTSSLNPSTHGQNVTFSMTVEPQVAGGGTPTGTVTLFDSGVAMSACTNRVLNDSVATCSTAALVAGGHGIVAAYSGDAVFQTSTSSPLVQTVN